MAFKEVPLGADENNKFWNPETENEFIDGYLCGYYENEFQGKKQPDRMVIETDKGNQIVLPGGVILTRYSKSLNVGDYIRVIYKGEKPSNTEGYSPTKLYKVLKDDEKKNPYEMGEDNE